MAAAAEASAQRSLDSYRQTSPLRLATRALALAEAAKAAQSGSEVGAREATRQGLVDLASSCLELADRLPAPSVWEGRRAEAG